MGVRGRIFAAMYDRMMAGSERGGLGDLRRGLLVGITGRVLEIGGGTGANLPFYAPTLESLTITEPNSAMVRRLDRRARGHLGLVKVLRAPAEHIPYDDHSFDAVVSTLVLCGVEDPHRALSEIRRVLRPGGQLHFLEHVRSDEPGLARVQDLLNPLSRMISACDCNRPTLTSIQDAGFTIAAITHGSLPKAPPFVRPMISGRAVAPGSLQPATVYERSARQPDGENGLPRNARDLDRSVMRFDDGPNDREPEARAATLPTARFGAAGEPFEHGGQHLRRDAGAVVDDADLDPA